MGGTRQKKAQQCFAACDLKRVPWSFSQATASMTGSLVTMAKGVAMMNAPLPKEAEERFDDAEKKRAKDLEKERDELVRDVQRWAVRTKSRFEGLHDELEDVDWEEGTTLAQLLRNMNGPEGGENVEKLKAECAELRGRLQTLQQKYQAFSKAFEERAPSSWVWVKQFFTQIWRGAQLIAEGILLCAEVDWEGLITGAATGDTGALKKAGGKAMKTMIAVQEKFAEAWEEIKKSVEKTDHEKAKILERLNEIAVSLGKMSTELTTIEGALEECSLEDATTRQEVRKLCKRILNSCEVLEELCAKQLTFRVIEE